MTLILSAMTQQCIVMVSDRRLTDSVTKKIVEHNENKVVLLADRLMLGYTGFAKLDKTPTDIWVAEQVTGSHPSQWLTILQERAAVAVRRVRRNYRVPPSKSRHAFLVAGWLPDESGVDRPHSFLISNFHDANGNDRSQPTNEFTMSTETLRPNDYSNLSWVGGLAKGGQERLVRALRVISKYSAQNPGRPDGIVEVLIKELLNTAEVGVGPGKEKLVGRDMLVTAFPRLAIGSGGVLMPMNPRYLSDRHVTASYLEDAWYHDRTRALMRYGPIVVQPDMILRGMEISDQPLKAL
ncbi:hypothetical protein AB0M43_23975 [Longispora sp. NPDC051575]|uniref:hypothetical protein n=1 Tax=Longispora sp. NPDC051575 TaxID=3154943 RepID=UPI0034480166